VDFALSAAADIRRRDWWHTEIAAITWDRVIDRVGSPAVHALARAIRAEVAAFALR
jgi:hypothetical protein